MITYLFFSFFLFQVSDSNIGKNEEDASKGELVTRSESPELLVKHPLQVRNAKFYRLLHNISLAVTALVPLKVENTFWTRL